MELAHALRLILADDPATNVVFDEGALHLYHPKLGLWQPLDDENLGNIVQDMAGVPCVATRKNLKVNVTDIAGAIRVAGIQAWRKDFFREAPVGLSFNNGFLEVSERGVVRQTKRSYANRMRHGYAWDYDPNATSPAFLAFIGSLFRDDADRAEKIAFLQELFGASLLRVATKYQLCGLLIGEGENGKDTLIDVLQSVFPDGTTSALGPHKWSQDYKRAMLVGKWLNVIGELPETDLESSEAFKSIVVGGEIDARHPYGRSFNFRPQCGHVFATNANIGTADFSHGFFRRFGVVRFNRQFTAADRDPTIKDRLTKTEGAAIIAWLIQGAARLIARGAYELPSSHHTELNAWRKSADQVAQFVEARARPLEAGEKGKPAAMLYQAYATWARENGHAAMSSTKFGGRAKAVLRGLGFPEHTTINGIITYPLSTKPRANGSVGMLGGLEGVKESGPLPQKLSNLIRLPSK